MALWALAVASVACQGTDPADTGRNAREITPFPGAVDRASLSGSGSTLVEPLLRQWIDRYKAVAPAVEIAYEAVGSGEGIARLRRGEGDYITSDVPLTEVEEVSLGGSEAIVQVPWAAGAIAVAYNLPGLGGERLRLTPQVLAAIFSGRLQRWDDPAIRADNANLRLPSLPIQLVTRSDPSGTTAVFTAYLSAAASDAWPLGSGRTARFPRGTAVSASEAVVAAVERVPGAVGYVQLSYAQRASLGVALLGNRAGRFVAPDADAVSAALVAAGLRRFSTTAQLSFTPDAPGAYPLSTFSYLMFRREGLDPGKAQALRHFASWALTEGQRLAEPLGYTAVPRQFQVPSLTAIEKG